MLYAGVFIILGERIVFLELIQDKTGTFCPDHRIGSPLVDGYRQVQGIANQRVEG